MYGWMDGWMYGCAVLCSSVHGHLTLCKDCSLAFDPSTLSQGQRFKQSKSNENSPSQLQIFNWSEACPYSICLSVMQLPLKEGTKNSWQLQYSDCIL